ncbi:MAG: monofunctional biosynthetic peptidoglycan transglycosylase [Candidatus Cloacimonetes bacterium]|nr:monofunctional biosynthetic peptidoglycan transglycosylase [Candidatus Cloacimonadota bacterium]
MKKKRSFWKRVLHTIFVVHLWYWGIIAGLSLLYNVVNPPVTPLMLQRYLIRGYPLKKRYYCKLENIPQRTQRMLIALEDGNFYKHFGFEWNMVKEAYQRNQKAGKIRFGASTISNQLARSIFLTTDRNYLRKYMEIQATLIMEICLPKKRMLELYFNYVEWGKGIYGIESAAQYYYGKSCRRLTRSQAMSVISVLTNPVKYSPQNYYNSASARQRYNLLQKYF